MNYTSALVAKKTVMLVLGVLSENHPIAESQHQWIPENYIPVALTIKAARFFERLIHTLHEQNNYDSGLNTCQFGYSQVFSKSLKKSFNDTGIFQEGCDYV